MAGGTLPAAAGVKQAAPGAQPCFFGNDLLVLIRSGLCHDLSFQTGSFFLELILPDAELCGLTASNSC